MTKNDPDIVRWSQIKRFLIHWFWWTVVYGVAGWLGDLTLYTDYETWVYFAFLFGFSALMTPITLQK